MAVEYVKGDIFKSGGRVLVNPCNCEGAAGSGLSQQFKLKYPAYYADYRAACARGLLSPGVLRCWSNGKATIVGFPTKTFWRGKSKYEWIESGLEALREKAGAEDWKQVHCPALGCGLGGLKFKEVRMLFDEWDAADTDLIVYEPIDMKGV